MDSAKHRDGKNNHSNNHEWENASFDWDNMKDGIFQKITEEDPHFFEEKRRRVPIWLWAGTILLLLSSIAFWLNREEGKIVSPKLPTVLPSNKSMETNQPIARESKQLKNEFQKLNSRKESTEIKIPPPNFKNLISKPFNEKEKSNFQNNPIPQISSGQVKKVETAAIKSSEHNNKTTGTSLRFDRKNLAPIINPTPLLPIKPFSIQKGDPPKLANLFPSDFDKNDKGNGAEIGQWKITASGGSLFSFSKYSGNSTAVALRNDHTSAYFGYQYGADIWMPLSKKDYLLLGVNRQVVYQNIDIATRQDFDTLLQNVHLKTTHYVVGDRTSISHGDTTVTAVKKYRLVKYNEFKSVQMRVGYAKVFSKDKWEFSPFINVAAGLITNTNGKTVASDKSIFAFNNDKSIIKRFQFNSQLGMGIDRQLTKHISLHFQYSFGKQWNNASNEPDMELRPAFHYFSLGVAKMW